MKTKEFEISWKGKKEKVKIRRMGWEEKNDFLEQFIDYKTVGNVQTIIPHPFKVRAASIRKCVVEAPFKTDTNSLNEIEDFNVLDKVWKEIERFNEMDETKKKSLDTPSETGQKTQK